MNDPDPTTSTRIRFMQLVQLVAQMRKAQKACRRKPSPCLRKQLVQLERQTDQFIRQCFVHTTEAPLFPPE